MRNTNTNQARSLSLDELRNADTITYVTHTIVANTGGVDGSLQINGESSARFPLDLWTRSENPSLHLDAHGVRTQSDAMSEDILRNEVTAWCLRHLGRTDVEFDVGVETMPHQKIPCSECPFRADNTNNARAKFAADRWRALSSTVRDPDTGQEPQFGEAMFACHKGEPQTNADLACAGWLATCGDDHLTVRLALCTGRLPPDALVPGNNWPPLHPSWADVVRHQTAPDE